MIRKIKLIEKGLVFYEGGSFNHINECKPSTEEAYIKQLKKEAHERFGEIKEGQKFKDSEGTVFEIDDTGFSYSKRNDQLRFGGWVIYYKGKWAERVKGRIEVSFSGCHHEDYKSHLAFQSEFFVYNNRGFDPKTASIFLASQLEKYLNNEL